MPAPAFAAALARATAGLPHHEDRPGQAEMAAAVGHAAASHRHLVVQAGTGTGKSLGYLVPLLLAGSRVVVATATKALQDQLATRDLPMLAEHLGVPFEFALLKGRSNYLCRQRAAEVGGGQQLALDGGGSSSGPFGREVRRLLRWAAESATGERGELPFEPSPRAWAQVSVGHTECPGASRCPSGDTCFAEAARQRATKADVVVVNTHLYAFHLLSGGGLLPPHDVAVIDEAHELEDIASASLGFELGAGRVRSLARAARPLAADLGPLAGLDNAADILDGLLAARRGTRVRQPLAPELADALATTKERVSAVMAASRHAEADDPRRARVLESGTHLADDLAAVLELSDHQVAWVEGESHAAVLEVAPLDVGAVLNSLWWSKPDAPTAVLTSATIPPAIGPRLGLPPESFDQLDVGSPFDYGSAALLYCARHLPDPRSLGFEAASHDELAALIEAAGGRTMALFTSWRAMQAAAAKLGGRVPYRVLTQADLPKAALVEEFRTDEQSCLFATMGFWQGVDVPGPALSLVVLDKIPFPRPDDPLLQARRDRLGRDAFRLIDLPRAATLLAQGAGRLIRSAQDRGVVAVLDRRLSTARYGWELVSALPPMRRTRHREEVARFLSACRAGGRQRGQDPQQPNGAPHHTAALG